MTDVDIAKLAQLARIAISEAEQKELEREIPAILRFVEQIAEAGGEVSKEFGDHYNVLREDGEPHAPGTHTAEMLDAMPNEKNGYLRVRKIISQD